MYTWCMELSTKRILSKPDPRFWQTEMIASAAVILKELLEGGDDIAVAVRRSMAQEWLADYEARP